MCSFTLAIRRFFAGGLVASSIAVAGAVTDGQQRPESRAAQTLCGPPLSGCVRGGGSASSLWADTLERLHGDESLELARALDLRIQRY